MISRRLSLIVTLFNEESTITRLLDSIHNQSVVPDEIIIVDGESNDKTVEKVSEYFKLNVHNYSRIKVIIKKGNRSIGRNEAIKHASSEIILITDSGCILDRNWVKEITKPFNDKQTEVVAGYYKGIGITIFQKCLIPYALVMPDRVNKTEFLPATRSMAFKKNVWKEVGGFDEILSHNEDYVFANKLKQINAKITFAKKAIVNWIPKKSLKEAFIMFFRFALGDAQASLYREKVIYMFLRYTFGIYLILLSIVMRSVYLYGFIIITLFSYIFWSIWKNYKYVRNYKAFIYLPLLQFTSDTAVLLGTTLGLIQKISIKSFISLILNNKGVFLIILSYVLILVSTISYGIPNSNRPFNYFMDEWHQSQSVRELFTQGTPNISGAANGSIFQFFLTGIYLIPFQILGVINIFAIKSSVTNLDLQFRLFEVLRINTLIFGVMSIALFSYISKKYFKLNTFIAAFLFTINPLWIMLSGYFKYDIALVFWIIVSFLFLLRYINTKSNINYMLAGFFSGLAFSVKLSAVPLLPIYILTFFLFTQNFFSKIKYLITGVTLFILTFMFFGIPDIILGKGSLAEYLTSNLIGTPNIIVMNLQQGFNFLPYLVFNVYPISFGHALYALGLVSLLKGLLIFIKNVKSKKLFNIINYKNYLLLLIFFLLFVISLYPLKIGAAGNRILVLLPFVVIISQFALRKFYSSKNYLVKYLFVLAILITFLIQLSETYIWIRLKISPDPRQISSRWILNNIEPKTIIGLENIPIYQMIPDILEKEFYLEQYKQKNKNLYRYRIIDSKTKELPNVIVLTNDKLEYNNYIISDKKDLFKRLKNENYKLIVGFSPKYKYVNLISNEIDFFMSGLILVPNTISIYEKQ